MLEIVLPAQECWDERKEEFVTLKAQTLRLEHSLVSISKWESKFKKEFLSKTEKTYEETLYYIQCMTITQNVNPETYLRLSVKDFKAINDYIEDPMTASSVRETPYPGGVNRERITSELIYYWMIALNIPFECQKWHLNRLLMLIRICNVKNTPPKKQKMNDLYRRHNAINNANRQRLRPKGV